MHKAPGSAASAAEAGPFRQPVQQAAPPGRTPMESGLIPLVPSRHVPSRPVPSSSRPVPSRPESALTADPGYPTLPGSAGTADPSVEYAASRPVPGREVGILHYPGSRDGTGRNGTDETGRTGRDGTYGSRKQGAEEAGCRKQGAGDAGSRKQDAGRPVGPVMYNTGPTGLLCMTLALRASLVHHWPYGP